MLIREATVADAEGIAIVHVDSWRTTYKNIIPNDFLAKPSYHKRKASWIENISNEGNHVYVAENGDGRIVGFINGGKRAKNPVADSGDLTAIYIVEEFQGMGIGKKLLKQLFLKLEELGFHSILVEVLDGNKSRFFYEAFGAKVIKSEPIKIAGEALTLLVYEWKDTALVLDAKNVRESGGN
ncbi:GNAT family acetyltransferase [Peribacillus simplex]|uniref:GNAT family acetyltransferase n=2 Tax=Peribacillus simplex TaxID=1478 RepID=A0A109MX42_9BACI|nr:GNAT family acetyltransferase [Peribacillus simplex]